MVHRVLVIILLSLFALQTPIQASPPESTSKTTNTAVKFLDFGVVLWVKDIEASVAFYRDDLGFSLVNYIVGRGKEVTELSPTDGEPYGATLRIGDHEIHLLRDDDDEARASGARYNVRIADPGEYYRRLVDRGLDVKLFARNQAGEPYWFFVRDPDGHSFLFMGPLPAKGPGESAAE